MFAPAVYTVTEFLDNVHDMDQPEKHIHNKNRSAQEYHVKR
jgi:hypothetical protein